MNYSFVVFWALAFAVIIGAGGFLFGGLARVFAQNSRRSPERLTTQAFVRGGIQGASFGAILGVPLGGIAGYMQQSDPTGNQLTIGFLETLGWLAGAALILGILGYVLESIAVWKR
jgi:hypothetical protein